MKSLVEDNAVLNSSSKHSGNDVYHCIKYSRLHFTRNVPLSISFESDNQQVHIKCFVFVFERRGVFCKTELNVCLLLDELQALRAKP
jgi:hypothetical protein